MLVASEAGMIVISFPASIEQAIENNGEFQ
jgi:hypothetical protein